MDVLSIINVSIVNFYWMRYKISFFNKYILLYLFKYRYNSKFLDVNILI